MTEKLELKEIDKVLEIQNRDWFSGGYLGSTS